VCRELTKRFEQIERGTLADLATRLRETPRGEITLVLGPAQGEGRGKDEVTAEAVAAVAELVSHGLSRRRAAEVVAGATGIAKNALYEASL
jgi:16S rRNA (cytidine1402-2'-O)-methyltransferase